MWSGPRVQVVSLIQPELEFPVMRYNEIRPAEVSILIESQKWDFTF